MNHLHCGPVRLLSSHTAKCRFGTGVETSEVQEAATLEVHFSPHISAGILQLAKLRGLFLKEIPGELTLNTTTDRECAIDKNQQPMKPKITFGTLHPEAGVGASSQNLADLVGRHFNWPSTQDSMAQIPDIDPVSVSQRPNHGASFIGRGEDGDIEPYPADGITVTACKVRA